MQPDAPSSFPPKPPPMARRVMLYPYQWVGLPALLLVPILALFGVLGVKTATVRTAEGPLEVVVTFPSRLRFAVHGQLEVELSNRGTEDLGALTVAVSREYATSFRETSFEPAADRIDEAWLLFDVSGIPAGESRRIALALRGEAYGRREGEVRVTGASPRDVTLHFATFTFP